MPTDTPLRRASSRIVTRLFHVPKTVLETVAAVCTDPGKRSSESMREPSRRDRRAARRPAAPRVEAAADGDVFEVRVDGFVIDVVRADGELVEIQTGGFSALRTKLDALLDRHRIRIVHPIPAERRIVRVDADGEVLSTRPSPKRPGAAAIFEGLVSFPTLLSHPHLTVEVLLCREDHVRAPAPVRGRRFMRDPGERRLVDGALAGRAARRGRRGRAAAGRSDGRSRPASWRRRCACRCRSRRRPRRACARWRCSSRPGRAGGRRCTAGERRASRGWVGLAWRE